MNLYELIWTNEAESSSSFQKYYVLSFRVLHKEGAIHLV